ncbi:MAG: alpha/beta hydrolase [Candidatus Bathyarchaeota archaeon]|nr:alpha/beta hydrolase [Candidatus Bathyarchaeota archaeon]
MSEKMLNVASHKCRAIYNLVQGAPIMFLHGFSYTGSVWQRISVTELLTTKQLPFLALDMPYGLKSECRPKTHDTETNVNVAHEAVVSVFGSAVPVLVGASVGGHIALSYAARFPVKGLLLVAPGRALEESLTRAYRELRFPVRIIWGSEDNIISGEEMRTLAGLLPNAKLTVYEGAGHSAYLAQPERFKRDLLELYTLTEQ